jgi:hypothetical protein
MGHAPRPLRYAAASFLGLGLLLQPVARGQVIEPNGTSVPATVNNGEITLQQYFTSQMETIDAVANAAAEPGVFLPLCDFQATLVLSQSQAQAGLAWYNVPTDPMATPVAVYPIGQPAAVVGQTINSSDVRNDPNYQQGLIGFVLMKNGQRVYYSEFERNVYCSACTMPGYWKMALAYQSTRYPNAYYLAFEDWEGANQMTWFGNDGDFNDKVFRIDGVVCNGGGQPCTTSMPGVCSLGVTECEPGGTITCKPQIQPTAEVCDNLDNDCNGMVDDGAGLCPGNEVCVQGTCVPPCGLAEFDCTPPYVCENGLCVDAACVGKTCDVGQVCRAGQCVGGCEGVVCPLGQQCQLGVCVDPCAHVSCPGAVCEGGVCITQCGCRICPAGQVCAADGHCVDTGCDTLTCAAGQVCRGGMCKDACEGAMCPGGAACHGGVCDAPVVPKPTVDAGAGSPTGGGGATVVGGMGGAPGGGGASGGGASGGVGAGDGAGGHIATLSCKCDAAGGGAGAPALLVGLALAGVLAGRRRGRG